MPPTPTDESDWLRGLLVLFKAYVVFGPLILVVLVRGAALDGEAACVLLACGYGASIVAFVFAGLEQRSSGLRGAAASSFRFAGASAVCLLALASLGFLAR